MNNQIMQLVSQIRQGQNPEQLMLNILQRQNNPMSNNLFNLAKQNRSGDIESIARNIMAQ